MSAIIGITTTVVAGRRDPLHWQAVARPYLEAVTEAGGQPVLLPWLTGDGLAQVLGRLDGLVLSGGGDVDPAHYGQARQPYLGTVLPERDRAELEMAAWALAHGLPTLGICRGAQVLVVATGGTLVQDIAHQCPQAGRHRGAGEPGRVPHPVRLLPGSRIAKVMGAEELLVNSAHHQCSDRIAGVLVASGWSEDGLVEAVEAPNHPFLVGVQWHPEELWQQDRLHLRLFAGLMEAAAP